MNIERKTKYTIIISNLNRFTPFLRKCVLFITLVPTQKCCNVGQGAQMVGIPNIHYVAVDNYTCSCLGPYLQNWECLQNMDIIVQLAIMFEKCRIALDFTQQRFVTFSAKRQV